MTKLQRSYGAVLIVLMIATVAFIWYNSMLDGERSSRKSKAVLEVIEPVLETLNIELEDPTDDAWLRKAAHVFEFALLGAELALYIRCRRQVSAQGVFSCLFVALLTAVLDESIQLYSGGRSSTVSDVLIDFSGALGALMLALLFSRVPRRKRGR